MARNGEIRPTHEPGEVFHREENQRKVLETIQRLQGEMLVQVEARFTEMTTEVTRQMKQMDSPLKNHLDENHKYKNRKKSDKAGGLPEKQFLHRNSLLTDLFEVKHIRTIYNIFVVILIILFINTALHDLVSGNLDLGLELIQWNFGQFRFALVIWLSMTAATLSIYTCFHYWATTRARMRKASYELLLWDSLWLAVLVMYQVLFLSLPVVFIFKWRLPPATAFSVLLEQVRMVMKSHAFVRSNAPRVLAHKPSSETSTWAGPGFSHFLYFLFCPTMLYRDTYPRTREIRWGVVARRMLEVLGVIFYKSFIFERWLVPAHRDWGLTPATPQQILVLVFGSMLPAMLALLAGFYCLLHAWLNATAEMMRFADRMFYQDWWNAGSYGEYYRMWNVVVHDWLYTYVYRDMRDVLGSSSRFIPTMFVFLVSAVVHEYVLAVTFGFCYPVLLFTFGGFGASLTFLQFDASKGGNIFMWLLLLTGTGLLTSLYCMEWYARINCIQTLDNWSDFFWPRSWNCIPITTS